MLIITIIIRFSFIRPVVILIIRVYLIIEILFISVINVEFDLIFIITTIIISSVLSDFINDLIKLIIILVILIFILINDIIFNMINEFGFYKT